MSERADLFPQAPRFRKPRHHLMHVIDAGDGDLPPGLIWTRMRCRNCSHEEDEIRETTVTKLKRGIPCPACNSPTPQAQE